MELKKEKNPKDHLNVDGTEYKTNLPDSYLHRQKYRMPELNLVRSFIPGTIRKIYVKEGQKVKKGDKMLVLEAMKMKNRLLAPLSGNVKKINVAEGENVKKDQVLFEIDVESK